MTSVTRKTLSLMAGALSLALAASPSARIDPIRLDDGERALLNRVERSPEMGTSIGGGQSVTGEQALLNKSAGGPDPAASDPAAERSRVQISGVQALLGHK
jgi:hypothetical protein